MEKVSPVDFTAERAWGKKKIAEFGNIGINLHWTNEPYVWHQNSGTEVFVVLEGKVIMQTLIHGERIDIELKEGEMLKIEEGEKHRAIPMPEARVLVIEHKDSK